MLKERETTEWESEIELNLEDICVCHLTVNVNLYPVVKSKKRKISNNWCVSRERASDSLIIVFINITHFPMLLNTTRTRNSKTHTHKHKSREKSNKQFGTLAKNRELSLNRDNVFHFQTCSCDFIKLIPTVAHHVPFGSRSRLSVHSICLLFQCNFITQFCRYIGLWKEL